jgi:hypothetical protein
MGRRVWGGECGAASLGWGGLADLEAVAGGGVPALGVAGKWVEIRDDLLFTFLHFFYFFIGLTSGPCPCQHIQNQLSTYMWDPPIRLGVNSRSTRDQCKLQKLPEKLWFFCD